jgi:hypothetical protein
MATAVRKTRTIDTGTAVEAVVDRVYSGDASKLDQPSEQALERAIRNGGRESAPTNFKLTNASLAIDARQRTLAHRSSVATVYERWTASWETALAELTTASRTGALSANDSAAHRTAIAIEREIVTKQLRLLGWVEGDRR